MSYVNSVNVDYLTKGAACEAIRITAAELGYDKSSRAARAVSLQTKYENLGCSADKLTMGFTMLLVLFTIWKMMMK